MILGIHHAQITIPKNTEAEARAFYCNLLGLREIPKPDNLQGQGGFWLQLPNAQVHVAVEDGMDRTKTKAHLAYVVENLATIRERISKQGIQIKEGLPKPGWSRFECSDPFGNRLEFVQLL